MARRQQKANAQGIVLAILLLLLAYIAPVVILVGWLIAEYRARNARSDHGGVVQGLQNEIALAQGRVDAIWEEGRDLGLNTRQDGMFDGRFNDGRRLNAALYRASEDLEDLQQQLDVFVAPLAQRDAMRGAALAWAGLFVFMWLRQPDLATFWKSVWTSVGALIVAASTYFVRRSVYYAPQPHADPSA